MRRTAAAAPVTTSPPLIPENPFIPFAGSSAFDRVFCLNPSHYPATPYAPRKRDGTPRRPHLVETLHVGHLGHTFDLERDYGAGSPKRRRRGAAQGQAEPAPRRRKAPGSRNRHGSASRSWPGAAASSRKRRPAGHLP